MTFFARWVVIAFVHLEYNQFHQANQINRAGNSGRLEDSRDVSRKNSEGSGVLGQTRPNHTLLNLGQRGQKSYPVQWHISVQEGQSGGSIPWGVVAADRSFAIICGAHWNALTH